MKTPKNNQTFFQENSFILLGNQTIYFREIIDHSLFRNIYLKEEIKVKFEKQINTKAARPFFNIPSAICKENEIKNGNLLALRILNKDVVYEFITKICMWGRVNVPREIISTLAIEHKQKAEIEIIKTFNQNKNDFWRKSGLMTIPRAGGFITLYSSEKYPITLPESITLSPNLIKSFFLIHGDGHYQKKLFFANKSYDLHRFIINVFQEELGIPKSIWRARINLNESLQKETAIQYWLKNLNLDTKQLYPSVSSTKFNTADYGNLRICIDYPIVSLIFGAIFDQIKENRDQITNFHALNGLLAAEGGAQISKKGLHKITLSYNNKEKKLFEQVLRSCGLLNLFKDKNKGNHGIFVLEKWEKLMAFSREFLVRDITPFSPHKERMYRALKGMADHSFTKTSCKYLQALEEKSLTLKELSKILKIRDDSCLSSIRKMQYQSFINVTGRGVNRNPFILSTSLIGKETLTLIYKIQDEAKNMEKQIFVKKEAEGKFGKFPSERNAEELLNYGIINIDKPKGPTEI